jgi:hypothetical protein
MRRHVVSSHARPLRDSDCLPAAPATHHKDEHDARSGDSAPGDAAIRHAAAAAGLRETDALVRRDLGADEAVHRFVFTNKKQLVHISGLTYDFLYAMAKDLDKRKALLLVRGGEKGESPVIMNRGGKPYNAFLEGRVDGDSYCLVLHLSNMELKRPAEGERHAEKEN